jgi:hypothetical protein
MSPGRSTAGNRREAAPEGTPAPSVCAELAERARRQLATHGQFQRRIDAFAFEVLGDTLVVRGRVSSFYLKQLVQTVLRDVEGVRWIDNQVEVIASNGRSRRRGV